MQAIITKYLPATNTRGSRIKATAYAGSVTVAWDHSLSSHADNYRQAAMALVAKYGLPSDGWVIGILPKGDGFAFVRAD